MSPIPPFDALAKSYGARIARLRGLSIISIACKTDRAVDIGFTSHRQSLLSALLRSPGRFEVAQGVFAYGPGATSVGELIRADSSLCGALNLMLSNFRCTVEWSGPSVSARVGVGIADGDATGGQRFLSNLALIADRLSKISERLPDINRKRDGCSPALARKIAATVGFVAPLILLFAVRYWFRRG